jgi:hypothetical protein
VGHEAADQEDDVVADLEVAADADAAREDAAAPDLRAARDRGRAADDGVRADAHVVRDLHEVVDLDAVLDHGVVDRAAVDGAVRADLDVVADHDASELGHLDAGACVLAGGVGIIGHLEICDDVVFLVWSLVTRSVSSPGVYSGSLPADEAGRWRRNASRFKHLDEYAARLRALEKKMGSEPDFRAGSASRAPRDRQNENTEDENDSADG